jgi:hypothetical protein
MGAAVPKPVNRFVAGSHAAQESGSPQPRDHLVGVGPGSVAVPGEIELWQVR